MTKEKAKYFSQVADKEALSKRSHACLILASYDSVVPKSYLGAAVNPRIKAVFMKYQKGCLPTYGHLPRRKQSNMMGICRLCGQAPETLIHQNCLCKRTMVDRKRLLRPAWPQRGLHRCKPAILAGVKGVDVQLSCRLMKFLDKLGSQLLEIKSLGHAYIFS
ncbi:hypothetical protein NDU88_005521 [Pleurodeles waltl]|uniref:Uncharacterized protein n=1 Tax=Pleurodeles waltl TaxID=8319 RepID=A0AAV7W827_PLEWA|nr:hypothetical protein NDU88_005521 [Pleurodeles waltl]